ncbi:uncharacterized protein METZ01_LOCUS141947, partial [marine metagenome]
ATEIEVMEDLYSDFIEAGDSQQTQLAENVVNYLQAAVNVKDVFKAHYNNAFEPHISLSDNAVDILYGDNAITSLPFSINTRHTGATDSQGWAPTHHLYISDLNILENGKIAKASCIEVDANNCTLYEPTYETITENVDYLSYGGSVNNTIIAGVTITSDYREARYHEDDGDINCQQNAILELVENIYSCTGSNCPTSSTRKSEITHNYGFQYWDDCTITDNPSLYFFTSQTNSYTDTKDRYSIQYSFKPNSAIYSDPPVNFLGAAKDNLDYQTIYNKMQEIFVSMDNIGAIASQMIVNESISMELNRMNMVDGEEVNVAKLNYIVIKSGDGTLSEQCKEYPLDSNTNQYDYSNPIETQDTNAFSTCYNHINLFNFHNE